MAYKLGGLDAIERWLETSPSQAAQERLWDWLVRELAVAPQQILSAPLPGTSAEVYIFPDQNVDVAVTYIVAKQFRSIYLAHVESLHLSFFGIDPP